MSFKCDENIFGIIIWLIGIVAMILGTFNSIKDLKNCFEELDFYLMGILLSLPASFCNGLNAVLMEKYILRN